MDDNGKFTVRELYAPLILAGIFAASSLFVALLVGCGSTPLGIGGLGSDVLSQAQQHAGTRLGVLSWVGGICTLFGVAAMVLTRGAIGLRAVGIGVGLVVLNYAVEVYADWIFIPVIVASGICSIALAYMTIRAAWNKRRGS
tara:strand:+ start:618 stop:1043 length:426 start_codon:yes stop_codon:yes gene_type:complete